VISTTPAPGAEYAAYRQVLKDNAALPPAAWTFKANPAYRAILEHVSPQQGLGYLDEMRLSPAWGSRLRNVIAETAMENDSLGTPERAEFDPLGATCSPTNLRYAAQALAILEHLEGLDIYGVNIIEIGGGYGGLALYLRRMARLFDQRHTHTIIDLPEAGAIQDRYAVALNVPLNVVDATDAQAVTTLLATFKDWPCYLVSAYGFSEFSEEVRFWYSQNVVPHCQHGYLVWNMIPVYRFTTADLTVTDERPLTSPGNKVVTF
jgi:hypothetical protein